MYNHNCEKKYKFSFVRNPWGRVVSYYLDKIKNANDESIKDILGGYSGLRHGMSFDEFVYFLSKNIWGIDLFADRLWLSQHKFITDRKGRVLVDFIGKKENLKEDFEKVCKIVGIKNYKLAIINTRYSWEPKNIPSDSGDEKFYRKYYNNKTRKLIGERYKKNIELFGYQF